MISRYGFFTYSTQVLDLIGLNERLETRINPGLIIIEI